MDPRALILLLMTSPAWAGPFKCQQPDGRVTYQETACTAESQGSELELDTRTPSGEAPRGKADELTAQGQLKSMESQRKKALKESGKTGTEKAKTATSGDRARCAKERAETARWRHETKGTYRDQDDKEYKAQMLAHHQALMERYCTK